jgi:hypothetical protein
MSKDLLSKTVRRLIEEGEQVASTKFDAGGPDVLPMVRHLERLTQVQLQPFAKWAAGCANLIRLLGEAGEPWKNEFAKKTNTAANATRMLGTLTAIE